MKIDLLSLTLQDPAFLRREEVCVQPRWTSQEAVDGRKGSAVTKHNQCRNLMTLWKFFQTYKVTAEKVNGSLGQRSDCFLLLLFLFCCNCRWYCSFHCFLLWSFSCISVLQFDFRCAIYFGKSVGGRYNTELLVARQCSFNSQRGYWMNTEIAFFLLHTFTLTLSLRDGSVTIARLLHVLFFLTIISALWNVEDKNFLILNEVHWIHRHRAFYRQVLHPGTTHWSAPWNI